MVLGVITTNASANEIANLEEILNAEDLPRNIPLKADKGYQSAKNEELLRNKKLKNHVLKKAINKKKH